MGQESDYVFAIWRLKEKKSKKEEREEGITYKDEAALSVAKNRYNGRLGTIKLYFRDNKFYDTIEEVPVPEI